MSKVNVGLRGWRFDEDEIFDESGEVRPLAEMPEAARNRLIRLTAIVGEPCDACWLATESDDPLACNQAGIVYGEPLAEVLLCRAHEPDFLYWFRECGGSEFAGTATLQQRFHEWFDDGGRAPEGYEGVEHVDRDPGAIPTPTGSEDLDAVESQVEELDPAERDALDVDLDDLDV
jgi:hypothetical protein